MLHVGLLILKIIGWILLGILCLFLGLILIILLVPVRYRIEGAWHGTLKGMARITWLLHILSVSAVYDEDGEFKTSIRLFGFRLFRDNADREVVLEEGLEEAGRDTTAAVHTVEDLADDSDLVLQTQELSGGEESEPEFRDNSKFQDSSEAGADGREDHSADEASPGGRQGLHIFRRISQQVSRFLEKIKFLFHTLCDKLKHIKDHYETALAFVKDEKNQETMKLILKQVKTLIRHILPRKASGYVVFGFDDPYLTGQVLAGASLLYAWYGQKIELIPMFDEEVLEGELKLKGRLRMGTILFCGLKVYLNKNFRVLLKRWRSM